MLQVVTAAGMHGTAAAKLWAISSWSSWGWAAPALPWLAGVPALHGERWVLVRPNYCTPRLTLTVRLSCGVADGSPRLGLVSLRLAWIMAAGGCRMVGPMQ